ncbi:integrase arm-type DNA-binding domain-containing protein [uncultured Albimonas sp.]|uniref:tyrosine-type recombinase/integrase n=1 Tax=uncultured Albimonas sp. TaxID=1331701 RepID=UPI0030EC6010
MPKLTARKVDTLKEPGLHGDGGGLYLRVAPTGGKSWVLRTVVHRRRRDLGLGSASLVTLAEARELARKYRKIAREGGDPDTLRKREQLTFEEAAHCVRDNLRPTWRSERHAEIWLSSLDRFAFPLIGKRPIDTLGTADVLRVLQPIWTNKNDTARRVKQRLTVIFDWAKGAGHYPHENPVNGLKNALPPVKPQAEHMAALPWADLPAFMTELSTREGISARALEFIILTAARSGEARGARWAEISGDVWTVPAERMKTNKAHRVPLSAAALATLESLRGLDPDLIFPSPVRGKSGQSRPLSDTVFKALMDRMDREGLTTHGFRSTFRDWCAEAARAEREVAEAALSHAVGDRVERAYARSDLFDRRRGLMEEWSAFCVPEKV